MKAKLAMAFALLLAGCQQKIQHDLDEAQANEIEALLGQAGIEAAKNRQAGRDAKWAISVPADRTAAAIRLLSDHDLPRKRAPGFAEVFGKGSMVPTAVEESALFLHALSGELAQTLSTLDGVAHARVHVVSAPASPQSAFRQPVKPRAAVLLKARPGRAAALELRRAELQGLVAGSVEGLAPENVAVMITEVPPAPAVPVPLEASGSRRWPLAVAALVAALLASGLVLALLYVRRLRARLAATVEPPAAEQPVQAQSAAAPEAQRAA
jgi:type III secretion protein J